MGRGGAALPAELRPKGAFLSPTSLDSGKDAEGPRGLACVVFRRVFTRCLLELRNVGVSFYALEESEVVASLSSLTG